METYVKLFGSILHSTVWQESKEIKLTWITLLAMSDKNGEIQASIPGVAYAAGVTTAEAENAIKKFMQPDPYSRSTEFEGRRLEKIGGGWSLLNHQKYRDMTSDEQQRINNAERQRRHRVRQKEKALRDSNVTLRDGNVIITHTDTDTDTDTDTEAVSGANAAPKRQHQQIQTSCETFQKAEKLSQDFSLNSNEPTLKEKTPEVPKKPKNKKELVQKNGYNAVPVWCDRLAANCKIPSATVDGQECGLLAKIGNMYTQREFLAMLKAYAQDRREKGLPWTVAEFYRNRNFWRSKARVGEDPNSEEALNAMMAKFEGSAHANGTS